MNNSVMKIIVYIFIINNLYKGDILNVFIFVLIPPNEMFLLQCRIR